MPRRRFLIALAAALLLHTIPSKANQTLVWESGSTQDLLHNLG